MGGLRERIKFIRVGTLTEPGQFVPDVHIYTRSKQPWIVLPKQDHSVEAFYTFKEIWSTKSMERLATIEKIIGITIS